MKNEAAKRAVRIRDKKCTECGMSNDEHKGRFGQSLHVHRLGTEYKVEECVALCHPCHQAKHSIKCAVRKRDSYACTECGFTNEEHKKLYEVPLFVYCLRNKFNSEVEWVKLGVKEDECVTLCSFCQDPRDNTNLRKMRRDRFQCSQCGRRPENWRLWNATLAIHRLKGFCHEVVDVSARLRDFTTLCDECHEVYHPDKLAEFLEAGWTLEQQEVFQRLGISSVRGRDQLKPYKEYLKLVHFFLELFENEGIPKKPQTALPMPETSLPESFRLEAFNQAIKDMEQEPYLSVEARKKLKKMTCEREPGRYGFRQYKSDASFSWELSKIRSVLKFGSRRWALG
jgi:hypothetical protein